MSTTKNLNSLSLLKQGRDETLKSFIKRYHEEVMEAGAFTYPLALEGLKKGLRIDIGWFVVNKWAITTY